MEKEKQQTINPRVSIWLIPSEKDKKYLGQLIKELANKYEASQFPPHITIYSTEVPTDQVEQVRKILIKASQNFTPITLLLSSIAHNDNLFQSLFVEFQENKAIYNLNEHFRKELEHYGGYSFTPHLSLLYKEIDSQEKEKIIEQLSIPQELTFDRLGIMVHKNPEDRNNIESWKVTVINDSTEYDDE